MQSWKHDKSEEDAVKALPSLPLSFSWLECHLSSLYWGVRHSQLPLSHWEKSKIFSQKGLYSSRSILIYMITAKYCL